MLQRQPSQCKVILSSVQYGLHVQQHHLTWMVILHTQTTHEHFLPMLILAHTFVCILYFNICSETITHIYVYIHTHRVDVLE